MTQDMANDTSYHNMLVCLHDCAWQECLFKMTGCQACPCCHLSKCCGFKNVKYM
ncbi:hypothetical protein BD289DRAFT_442363 [Coniella lustricola]|uniref:Uncharacterized protein n=1 Tax=Coniella lustricola TaxID=2025994 RepID=A0A2T2ZYA0_9PEZI|nr:hypothetical protein BD289DRAFT_442363 [Coniella lustricola]